ncbi:uncharacterized protein LAESUDRAFT_603543, partial [Laetiporus sulphureus 93-53]
PFKNGSIFHLLHWQYTGSNQKSEAEMQRLIDIITEPDFDANELKGVRIASEWKHVEAVTTADANGIFKPADGWKKASVKIPLPKEREEFPSEADAPMLNVPDVYHRSLLEIIKSVCMDDDASFYHWHPFMLYWRRPRPDSSDDGS